MCGEKLHINVLRKKICFCIFTNLIKKDKGSKISLQFISGSVTEVQGKNTKGKVKFLKKFFSKGISIFELEEEKGLLFRDNNFYEVYFLYN